MNVRMQKRIAFGAIMIAVLAGLLWLDWFLTQDVYSVVLGRWLAGEQAAIGVRAIPLAGLVLLLLLPALRELRGMAQAAGVQLLGASAYIGAAGLATMPFWWQFAPPMTQTWPVLLAPAGAVMLVFAQQMASRSTADAFRKVACTLLAVAYLGLGGAVMLAIRMDFNLLVLVLFLAAVKFTDIGAYFTGSFLGRHKLIAWLSPGKTWEGLAGGLALAAGVAALATLAMDVRLGADRLGLIPAAVFGAVVGLAGQFGDLAESLLKRATNVKDSGRLVPEFGGVLDILDSPLLGAPVAYVMLLMMR